MNMAETLDRLGAAMAAVNKQMDADAVAEGDRPVRFEPKPADDSDAQQKAVAKALEQPLFDDHSKGLIASLQADADKLQRASLTVRERQQQAEDRYKENLAALRAANAAEQEALAAELEDVHRAQRAIAAAVAELTKKA